MHPRKTRKYIVVEENDIKAYPVVYSQKKALVDTSQSLVLSFPEAKEGRPLSQNFVQSSFDIDVLTIPFKYRPPASNLPGQLTSNFTGSLYLGYRSDIYKITYQNTPLWVRKRKITHVGYSFGLFSGIGSAAINPSVTNQQIAYEYDGVVFNKGLAGIIGVNNFTFGLGIGLDHLLDQNQGVWIYQGRPWLGLTIGLNIN
jgi:hypothetical protein